MLQFWGHELTKLQISESRDAVRLVLIAAGPVPEPPVLHRVGRSVEPAVRAQLRGAPMGRGAGLPGGMRAPGPVARSHDAPAARGVSFSSISASALKSLVLDQGWICFFWTVCT